MKLAIEKRIEYLKNINAGMAKSRACEIVGVSRVTGNAWLQDFYDNGPPSLNFEDHVAKNDSRKTRHKNHDEIVKMASRFPQKGAKWLSKKLNKQGIKASTGGIYNSLKSENLEKKAGRLEKLFEVYDQNPENLDKETIIGMEFLSPHFKNRELTKKKPGELIYIFREKGRISNSRKNVYFTILLDSCGAMVFIEPNIYPFLPEIYRTPFFSAELLRHPFIEPIQVAKYKFYDFYDFRIHRICVGVKGNIKSNAFELQNQLKEMNINVDALKADVFNNIPFIADFRKHFKENFLKKRLKTIKHRRFNEETMGNITNTTTDYIKHYNIIDIQSWPNRGKSPYEYVSYCTRKKIYLPSRDEWYSKLKKSRKKNRPKNQ